jgi:hypothetical protein
MSLTKHDITELPKAAGVMLKRKLLKIPSAAFYAGRKPTILEIYGDPQILQNPLFHSECQLHFVFRNYNKFKEFGL